MYEVVFSHAAAKSGKKQGKQFVKHVGKILNELADNPRPKKAEKLSGELSYIYSYHFSFSGTAFRLCYDIDEEKKLITVVMLGPRENIYKILKQKLK